MDSIQPIVNRRLKFLPTTKKAKFFSSFYHWNQREGLIDIKKAICKAREEAGVSLKDARDLLKEVNGQVTSGLIYTRNKAILFFFMNNWESLMNVADELLKNQRSSKAT